jgi:glycosyltransferase involved in cell wall biosynthesis
VRVLYVNHSGLVSGAERSLLDLLEALPTDIEAQVACPPGPLPAHAARRGVRATPIVASTGSLRLHPIQTPVALGAMATASGGVLRAARSWDADVIHANSIRAGMIATPVSRAMRRPLILHVRDCLPDSLLTRTLQSSLAARADTVIAISQHVADAFDPCGVARRLEVVDNPFDLARIDSRRIARADARTQLGLSQDAAVLALVGQITPWKGQADAIQALAQVRTTRPSTVLLIVGEPKFVARATRYDNRAYLRALRQLVAELELGDAVRFLGEREDVPEIFSASDVALVPSWEEPFGRVVVEAMATGVPVVATAVGGPPEIIRHGVDGLLVSPRRPDALAAAITGLLSDEAGRSAMGRAARVAVVRRFGKDRHAARLAGLYREVCGAASAGRAAA